MTLRLRFLRLMLAVACALALRAAPLSAQDQTAPVPPPQNGVVAGPVADAAPEKAWRFKEDWPGQVVAYDGFLIGIAGEPETPEQAQQCGCVRVNWAKILGIREDEEQAMRTIMNDAETRIREANFEYMALDREAHNERGTERAARRDALGQQWHIIVEATVAKLRSDLGQEDFKKLDSNLFERNRPGKIVVAGPFAPGSTGSSTQESRPDQQSGSKGRP